MNELERDVALQLQSGENFPAQIATKLGVSVRSVNRALRSLKANGYASQLRPRSPWSWTGKPIIREEVTVKEQDLYLPISGGYLYAIEFENGVIKVGKSCRPKARIMTHRANGSAFGQRVINQWISRSYSHPSKAERQLISWCQKRGERISGNEYFKNLIFSEIIEYAQTITD